MNNDNAPDSNNNSVSSAENGIPMIGKILESKFAAYLSEFDNEVWELEGPSKLTLPSPFEVEELMFAISMDSGGEDDEYVYIFNQDEDPYDAACRTDWDNIPVLTAAQLDLYIGVGSETFWFDCSAADASNGNPMVLYPGKYLFEEDSSEGE